jgi:hypothetical protein
MCIFLVFGYPCGFPGPPFVSVGSLGLVCLRSACALCSRSLVVLSWSVVMSHVSFVPSAFDVSRPSPASWLAWSKPVVISSYEWLADSNSVRLHLSSGDTPVCRYDGLADDAERRALTWIIRRVARDGIPVILGVAGNNRGSHWFCAIRTDLEIVRKGVHIEMERCSVLASA